MTHQLNAETVRQLRPVELDWTPEPAGPRPVLRNLAEVQPERIDWLWDGYLARGKVHTFDGNPGLGKSTALLDLAAKITTGTAWPDGQPGTTPAGVVLLSAEDGLADTIRPRLDAADADVTRVVALTGITVDDYPEPYERLPVLPGDIDHIADAIAAVDAALVVIDPLMAFLDGKIDSHKDQSIRRALTPLTRAAETSGAAVVIVRHLTKADGGPAIYRGGGSIGIIGAARLGFTVARDRDNPDQVIIASTKSNIGPEPASLVYHLENSDDHGCARVIWDGITERTADDLTAPHMPDRETNQGRALAWLTDYLTEHEPGVRRTDVMSAAVAAGHAVRNIERAFKAGPFTSSTINRHALWQLDTSVNPPSTRGSGERGEVGEGDHDHA